jgi:hypothetical protein
MEVIITIPITEDTVMNAEIAKERMKSDCVNPLTKLSSPAKVSLLGSENGASAIKKLPFNELIIIIAIGERKINADVNRTIYMIVFRNE